MSDQAPTDEPIAYSSGRVRFSDQFKTERKVKRLLRLMDGDKQKAQDMAIYLFFVYHPKSNYRKMPETDRLRMLLREKRISPDNKGWLLDLIKTQEMIDVVDLFCELALTPGQRLYMGIIENANRHLKEISAVKGSDPGVDPVKLVEKGKNLFESIKSIEDMMQEEKGRKIKAGYQPHKFETPRDIHA